MKIITDDSQRNSQPRLTSTDYLLMSNEERIAWLESYRGKREHLQLGKEKKTRKQKPTQTIEVSGPPIDDKVEVRTARKSRTKSTSVDDLI